MDGKTVPSPRVTFYPLTDYTGLACWHGTCNKLGSSLKMGLILRNFRSAGEHMKRSNGILKSSSPALSVVRMLLLVCALAVASGAAKADSFITYDVTGVFASGGTLSGSFTFDTSQGSGYNTVTAVDLWADGTEFTNCPVGLAGTCNVYNSYDNWNRRRVQRSLQFRLSIHQPPVGRYRP